MKLSKIALAVFTTASCLAPLAPAHAGPLDQYGGSMLDPKSDFMTSVAKNQENKALCDDIVAADKVEANQQGSSEHSDRVNQRDTWDMGHSSESKSKKDKREGFSAPGGVGLNMSNISEKEKKASDFSRGDKGSDNMSSDKQSSSASFSQSHSSSKGKTCSTLYVGLANASAARDGAAFAADAQVKIAETQVKMTEIATKGKVEAIKIESNAKFMENLMNWK
jgi:hypothetical protein